MAQKHFCVIGAGASGLVSIKSSLEHGARVTCFERTEDIGGLWRYTEDVRHDKASVSKSTVINTSKELTSYSDFLVPADYPNFMRHDLLMNYFRKYAEHFDLIKHVQFNIDVLKVDFAADYETTGRWDVTYKSNKGAAPERTATFDGVFVCTGHHAEPHKPTWPGLDQFKGTVLHTHDYKRGDAFVDKNVLIIGIGNSGGDIAVELCRHAKSLHISTRRGTWCFPRSQPNGMPLDAGLTRFGLGMMSYLPPWMNDWFLSHVLIKTDHDLLGIRPNFPPSAQHSMVNDDFPNRILSGLIKVQPDVKCFGPNSVTLIDGTEIKDLDAVILATGYVFGFPFLPKSVINVEANKVDLYKLIFPPDLKHPTLAVIGCIQPLGSIISISELQSRWAVRVLAGDQTLPSNEEQWQEINQRRNAMAHRYVASQRHTIQVDGIPYCDDIAREIGCMPSFYDLAWTDFKLALACVTGMCVPYMYRLTGPHAWPGAREAILTVNERIREPLKTHITMNKTN